MIFIVKCNKFGQGWYRFDGIDHFEYNPYVMEKKGTTPNDVAKRMPIGSMALQRGGHIIRAEILDYRWSNICDCYMAQLKRKRKFLCKKYGSELDAFQAAAKWIMHEGTSKNNHRQMDLFPNLVSQFNRI